MQEQEQEQKQDRKHILVVKNRAMGDAIMGLSTLDYLRSKFPQARLVYAVPTWVAPLFTEGRTPSDILPFSLKGVKDWWHFWRDLRQWEKKEGRRFDIILELHQNGRSGHFFRLLSLLSLFRSRRYFFHNHHWPVGDARSKVYDQGVIKPLIQRDLDGAASCFRLPPLAQTEYLKFTPRLQCLKAPMMTAPATKKIILGVVATRDTKKWPLTYYAQIARLWHQQFPQDEILIPLSRSAEDEAIKEQLLNLNLPATVSFVQASLADLPAKLQGARFYLGNDTGLKHLAVALGIKTYTFFGPEPILEWHPYDLKEHPVFFLEGLACRTRTHHYCGLSRCESMACLLHFTPKMVMSKIVEAL